MERRRRITGDQFVGERRLHAVGDLETGIRERPHTTGKGCLYVKKLSDADLDVSNS